MNHPNPHHFLFFLIKHQALNKKEKHKIKYGKTKNNNLNTVNKANELTEKKQKNTDPDTYICTNIKL